MYLSQAKLLAINPFIEEEVTLEINGLEIIAFADIVPYVIKLNETYPVEFWFEIWDNLDLTELSETKYGLTRISDDFEYILYGQVIDDCIDIGNGIKIQNPLFNEYTYLNGKFISLRIDRLDVAFE